MMMDDNNIDDLFRRASAGGADKFPASEKIWSRVEQLLEKQQLTRSKRKWRKMAIAASFLLFTSIGFQLWRDNIDESPAQKELDRKLTMPALVEQEVAVSRDTVVTDETLKFLYSPNVKTNKPAPEPQQLRKTEEVVVTSAKRKDLRLPAPAATSLPEPREKELMKKEIVDEDFQIGYTMSNANRAAAMAKRANGVQDASGMIQEKNIMKSEPIYLLNGEALTAKSESEYKRKKKAALTNITELDSLFELKEPLYIINDTEYSEKELFGDQPTSPYYPLHLQEVETMEVFREKEAERIFGPKGKKGVVVITTKNRKPVKR